MILLTPKQVAERLNMSRSSVYDLLRARTIPVCEIGTGKKKTLRVIEEDLTQYILRGRKALPTTPLLPIQSRRGKLIKAEPLARLRAAGFKG